MLFFLFWAILDADRKKLAKGIYKKFDTGIKTQNFMLIIIPLKKLPQIFEQKCIRKPFDNQQIVKQKKKKFSFALWQNLSWWFF